MRNAKLFLSVSLCLFLSAVAADAQTGKPDTPKVKPAFDAEIAKKVGADQYGMKQYVLVILKTGPKQMEPGKERDALFAGHLANINRLADDGKLAVAGPFIKNDKDFRGLFILNVKTVEEAKALVDTDPTVKAGILMGEFVPWYGSAALMETNTIHKKITEKEF